MPIIEAVSSVSTLIVFLVFTLVEAIHTEKKKTKTNHTTIISDITKTETKRSPSPPCLRTATAPLRSCIVIGGSKEVSHELKKQKRTVSFDTTVHGYHVDCWKDLDLWIPGVESPEGIRRLRKSFRKHSCTDDHQTFLTAVRANRAHLERFGRTTNELRDRLIAGSDHRGTEPHSPSRHTVVEFIVEQSRGQQQQDNTTVSKLLRNLSLLDRKWAQMIGIVDQQAAVMAAADDDYTARTTADYCKNKEAHLAVVTTGSRRPTTTCTKVEV